jgi:hypothetical protein
MLGATALACSLLGWVLALGNLAALSQADQARFYDSTGFPDRLLYYIPASALAVLLGLAGATVGMTARRGAPDGDRPGTALAAILLSLPLVLSPLACCLFVV